MKKEVVYKLSKEESLNLMETLQDVEHRGTFSSLDSGMLKASEIISETTNWADDFEFSFKVTIEATEENK